MKADEQLQKNGKSGRSKRDVSSLDASKKDFSALTPIDEETYTVEGIVTEKEASEIKHLLSKCILYLRNSCFTSTMLYVCVA
ncbi:hypothetical protein P4V47_23785 [Brevibacillus laterosporus]|uniref:hypothetical protein n=1 Tax=Brevibacillus laterosporus TaxID=1465 RepID=UPI002E246DF5|nr:hypothetical protein [Brevibacillus laterosporus]